MIVGKSYLRGSVLPTVVVVSVLILTGLLGLLALWEHETLLFARSNRLRQARADVESTYALYRLHPDVLSETATDGYLLYDSLPQSRVQVDVRPWGLYETVRVTTADSLLSTCRIFGAAPHPAQTIFYADNRSSLTLAGKTVLHGQFRLPQNGLVYGRVNSDFFCGEQIPQSAIQHSEAAMPAPQIAAEKRIEELFALSENAPSIAPPDSLRRSFVRDSTLCFHLRNAEVGGCLWCGNIILYADELRIDASCRMEHILICARKVTVGAGARLAVQIFARDTVCIEARAVLEYPSGVYSQGYAEIGDAAQVNGYVIVRDTMQRKEFTANYRQWRTARVRGLVWVEGTAQVQGMVCGRLWLRCAAYFSPQGYYQDLLYDATLLENAQTTQPLWIADDPKCRKEAVCVD